MKTLDWNTLTIDTTLHHNYNYYIEITHSEYE